MAIQRIQPGKRLSAAVVHGDTIYIAGQIASDPATDVKGQTQQILKKFDDLLAAAGVPCGAVLDSAEVMSNQHLIERGMIVDVEHPVRGKFRMPGNAIQMSGSPTTVTRAPLVGEHNLEVFGALAGLLPEELAALAADGVI